MVPPKQVETAWDEIRNHSSVRLWQYQFRNILETMNRIENSVHK